MNDLRRTLTHLLELEAQDSKIPEPEFKLGYLLSFVASHEHPALLRDAQARIHRLEERQNQSLTMPAPTHNNYATKPDAQKTSAGRVPAAFTPPEKARVMRAHRGRGSLSRFVALAALAAVDAKLPILPPEKP